jgi:hypothetical protein
MMGTILHKLKITSKALIGVLFGIGFSTSVVFSAAAEDDPLYECIMACAESAAMITDPAWAHQYLTMCNNNCIEWYDGGFGNPPPGTGTTPINPGVCDMAPCVRV